MRVERKNSLLTGNCRTGLREGELSAAIGCGVEEKEGKKRSTDKTQTLGDRREKFMKCCCGIKTSWQ